MAFVDSSFWIALNSSRDQHYGVAREIMRTYRGTRLVTSNLVRGESWTWLNRRHGHRVAVDFLGRLERSKRTQVLDITPKLEEQALRWLRRHDERSYSFVDATSFILMKSLRLRDAMAFDGDFAAAGFRELRA